jgi:glucosamine--fructose-6-phosphate aminotransferase (isomerizing)
MIVCRRGSPLLIGLHDDSIFVASEKIAFEKYTSNFISLKDGEVMELDIDTRREFYSRVKTRTI